mgnify:FL=1
MSAYVAFYKGRPGKGASLRDRYRALFDATIRLVTRSRFSHCEFAIPDPQRPDVYFCVSSSSRDGGVRGKYMRLPSERWELLPAIDPAYLRAPHSHESIYRTIPAATVREWLEREQGSRYDWCGVFRFICPFLRQSPRRWFCSEFVAAVLELPTPAQQSPASLYRILDQQSKELHK